MADVTLSSPDVPKVAAASNDKKKQPTVVDACKHSRLACADIFALPNRIRIFLCDGASEKWCK